MVRRRQTITRTAEEILEYALDDAEEMKNTRKSKQIERIKKQLCDFYAREYMSGFREGSFRRKELERAGLLLETMATNSYSGSTFIGLYGYMDAMEQK